MNAEEFEIVINRLRKKVKVSNLEKALAMLKKERFQLYAEVHGHQVIGIVKSQTDAELIYSCRLISIGTYCCCTQNLNVCGGIRGGICKHLLVLTIGLMRAGKLDPKIGELWLGNSRFRRSELDKEAMSATLLKFKHADAGDIDWRPIETLPEDYYAF